MRSVFWSGALAATLLAVPAQQALAQDPPFDRIQVTRLTIKPGTSDTFEAHMKRLNEARAKVKDPVARTLRQVGRGGPARTYWATFRFDKWADLESLPTGVVAKAFGEREAALFDAAMAEVIESSESSILTVWKGVNAWKDGTPAYVWVYETDVQPAAIPQWEQQVAARAAAAKKSPASPPTVRYRTTLGPSARFVTARYFDKWSDVDGWPALSDLLPAAEADKVDATARGAVESARQYVLRRRPEMSYVPAP
jgi:hypothetical protein